MHLFTTMIEQKIIKLVFAKIAPVFDGWRDEVTHVMLEFLQHLLHRRELDMKLFANSKSYER